MPFINKLMQKNFCHLHILHLSSVTQETFLRYFEKYSLSTAEQAVKCLYTIARNLCIDEYRRKHPESLQESSVQEEWKEEQLLTSLAVKSALSELEMYRGKNYNCINYTCQTVVTLNRSPSTSTSKAPPWSSEKLLAMANPKPLPSVFLDASPLTNRSVRSAGSTVSS